MNLSTALRYLDQHTNLEATAGRAEGLSLERMERLVSVLGDPQDAYPVIHITGTNGKGSVARMVTELLAATGLSVGTYTSPHLEAINERVARNGEPISDDELGAAIGAVAAVEAACQHMGGERQNNVTVAADWVACGEQRLPFFTQAPAGASLWRVSLPQTAPALSLGGQPPEAQLVEWHGAQRWVWAPAEQAVAIRAAAQAAGGHATLFRPAAEADRSHGVFTPLAGPLADVHRRLKAEFDPAGIFGPGRLYQGV